jgi:hypothetical protein
LILAHFEYPAIPVSMMRLNRAGQRERLYPRS